MKQPLIYVANSMELNGITFHLIMHKETILSLINDVYGAKPKRAIVDAIDKKHEFHSIDRYYQFVGYIRHDNRNGLLMQLMDFKGDIDLALDEYSRKTKYQWDSKSKDDIVRVCADIKTNPATTAIISILRPNF
ncbi:MAG TPA: hypothetical protein PLI68_05755 [Bacteroidia bacterium]|nr:hypothetical protein [Bacteroidia bacterium]